MPRATRTRSSARPPLASMTHRLNAAPAPCKRPVLRTAGSLGPGRDRVENDLAHAGQRVDVLMAIDERRHPAERGRERIDLGGEFRVDRRQRQGAHAAPARAGAPSPGRAGQCARSAALRGAPSVRLKCRPSSSGRLRPGQRPPPPRRQPGALATHDAALRRASAGERDDRLGDAVDQADVVGADRRGCVAREPLTTMPRLLRRSARCRGERGRPDAA